MTSESIPSTSLGPAIGTARSPDFARAARIAGAVSLADVAPTTLRWLWPGRIPLGRVTLLVSDPGLGKSLVTLDIAARVSSGSPWPDEPNDHNAATGTAPEAWSGRARDQRSRLYGSTPSVLLLTAEDDLADTIRPRLEAMGADLSRIIAIPFVPSQAPCSLPPAPCSPPRALELKRDLARLANLLDAMPDCRLLVVDPISAYLGDASEHVNAEVQSLMLPLSALARERGLAVLAVSHLRKKDGAAIYRTMGSLAFVAAARAVWVVSKDPQDDRRRLLLPLKNNLAPDATGLAYTIEPSKTPPLPLGEGWGEGRLVIGGAASPCPLPRGEGFETASSSSDMNGPPVIRWLPDLIAISADSIVGNARRLGRPGDERQQAVEWLQQTLAAGPRLSRDVIEEADARGFCYRTLKRAFRDLGGQAVRERFGPFGQWWWQLPSIDGQNVAGTLRVPPPSDTPGIDGQSSAGEYWPPPGFSDALSLLDRANNVQR